MYVDESSRTAYIFMDATIDTHHLAEECCHGQQQKDVKVRQEKKGRGMTSVVTDT